MYKKYVFFYFVEWLKYKFGEIFLVFVGCYCVYVIEDCLSDYNMLMKYVWILYDIYVLKICFFCFLVIKCFFEDGIMLVVIENGVF